MDDQRMRLWEETFRHARERSTFYREAFAGCQGVPELVDVPTLDKAQLSARNLDFLCVPRERVVEIVTTSGTAGRPLVWMLTERDLQRLALNEKLSFTCVGLTARDTVLLAVTMDRAFMAGLAYWLGLRELGCGIVRVGPSSPALVLEMIQRTQPSAIVAVPSFLRIVAEKAHETGFDLANAGVKKLICIGEPIRDVSLAPNATGRLIEQAWGARAYSTYGVTELANSLCECDAGAGGHLHEEMLYVEILDDEGRPVPDGEVGEVVATTFGVEAMPLIRYRTGDCAAMFRESCRCGRTSLRVGPIVGRKHQKLKVKGVSLFPSALQAALEDTDGVDSFVIVARSEGGLSDTVEVLVNGPAALSTVRDVLRGRTRIVPSVRQASREEIEALQLPANTRKRRFFVDLR